MKYNKCSGIFFHINLITHIKDLYSLLSRPFRLIQPLTWATGKFLIISAFITLFIYNQLNASINNPIPALPPVAICKSITVQLGAGGTVTITGLDVDGGSYDPDGTITKRVVTPSTFNCSQKGTNNVTLTVTDNEGLTSSCNTIVIVEDKILPVMSCRNFTLWLDGTGKATLSPANVNNGSTDNCGSSMTYYLNKTQFSCADIGSPVSVILTGTDGSGNSASCTAQVTVLDTISPVVLTKPYTLVLGSSGTGTLTAANVNNGSYDNCGPVTMSVSPTTFTCSDLGSKTVFLTVQDSHGNKSTRSEKISVTSTLNITGISLSSCDLAPTLALYQASIEGGNGTYSYFWKGLDETTKPFMVIIPTPPSLQFYNSSVLPTPFFNNTMPNGLYDIRLVVTDGNGCKDTSQMTINKTGTSFNNQTIRYSNACEGEIRSYSVNFKSDATYSWQVTNGTILTANQDTSKIDVRWNLGVTTGKVEATLNEPNTLFPGGNCESSVIDNVSISPSPVPSFNNPVSDACANSVVTYTLTSSYSDHLWSVTGGVITGGGRHSDNYVSVRWGSGPAGNISATVFNNSLCSGSVALNITIFNLTGKITSITNIKCNGSNDGQITVAADAGTGVAPYMYSVDSGAWQAGGSFTGISLGNHIAHIRDALLCIYDIPFVITQLPPVTGTVSSQTNISCFGGLNGSITVTASGGTSPYQYSLNGGTYQNQNIFNGLSAGTYTVTIRDSNGCTGNVTVTLTQPSMALAGTVFVTNVTCFGASTGSINLTVTGGTPPYSFLWNNGAATEDLLNITAGNYSVVITDSRACTATVAATVTQPAIGLSGTTSVTNVLCFGASTGVVNLTVSGGTAPFTYLWSNGATTEDLANVPAAVYSVTIRDANGCTAVVSATVTQPASALTATINTQVNILCKGGNNGSFTVTGGGGTGPYQYQLGSGVFQASGTFGTLTAGTYNITVRDANLCTYSLSVTITEPALALSGTISSQTNVLCFGAATGSITISGSGGTSPYEYNIDGGTYQASSTFNGLAAGAHSVSIRDKNLCTFSLPLTITQPLSTVDGAVTSQTNVDCFGASTGAVTVAGSGGTPPYTYSIDGGAFQPSGTFTNLKAGAHSVTVRDNNLCQKIIPVVINQPPSGVTVTTSKTDVRCLGGSTGTATAIPSGGTPPYTYSWNTVPVQTNATATGLIAGVYSVTVTDSRGCIANTTVTVTQPAAALTAAVSVTDVACNGGSTGAINLTVTNGILPIAYLWSNGATTEDLANLTAGTYTVNITDANGCTASASGTVGQPQALNGSITATNVVCYGNNTGSLDLTVTGGVQPYTYLWSNGSTTQDVNNLAAGTYTVTITDKNGCKIIVTGNVTQPLTSLSGSISSQTDVSEYGGNDGSVTITGSGGTVPYQYRLDSGTYQLSGTFNSLAAGTYIVTVQDAALCTFSLPVTITQPWIPLTAKVTSHVDVACSGDNTGSITITGWGGTSPYNYRINGGTSQSSGTFNSLTAGAYTFNITDAASGSYDTLITITEPSPLNLSISKEDNHCFGGASGTATASVTGGVMPYNYTWNTFPVQINATATGLKSGTYTVTITDTNGCTVSGNVVITEPSVELIITLSKTDIICPGEATGTAKAEVTGGSVPYSYVWNTTPVQTTDAISGLAAGNYTVTVTDSYGCIKSSSIDIIEPEEMSISASVTKASCPDSNDGAIMITISGGISPYTYLWSDSVKTQDRTNLKPGNYTLTVVDQNGCMKTEEIEVGFEESYNCLVIPDLITPNADGHNDEWRIRNIDLYPDAELSIYNRWGQLVFRTKNISANPWDGKSNGKLVPTDSYHYILRLNDGSEPRSGVISVIR